jgi:hypothetical protein
VFFLDRNFSPFLSLGLTHIQLSGTGKFRELDSSALLAELGLGAEYYFEQNLRLAVGWAVHVPIRIQIPFVELSFGF